MHKPISYPLDKLQLPNTNIDEVLIHYGSFPQNFNLWFLCKKVQVEKHVKIAFFFTQKIPEWLRYMMHRPLSYPHDKFHLPGTNINVVLQHYWRFPQNMYLLKFNENIICKFCAKNCFKKVWNFLKSINMSIIAFIDW